MKRAFKTLGIFLSAFFLLTACSSDDALGEFNENGEFVIKDKQQVSLAEFNSITNGYGWYEAETHEILDNGQYKKNDYWKGMAGGAPSKYEFKDGIATLFLYMDAFPADTYSKYSLRYEENTGKVFFDNQEQFTVLSMSSNEIWVIKKGGQRGDGNGNMKQIYLYAKLQKMTDEELQSARNDFWLNTADLNRDITRKDICHKWVLTHVNGNMVNNNMKSSYDFRSNDFYYITFYPDGTLEGKSSTVHFKGTYVYDPEQPIPYGGGGLEVPIQLIPDETEGEWPLMFQDLPKMKFASFWYASYLSLSIDNQHYYQFIRGIEE